MQINSINTNSHFGAGFSSAFNVEVAKLREKIYVTSGKSSNEMADFDDSISNIAEKFRDGRIVICKKGLKGTFLEINNKKVALLSPKIKKYTIADMREIAHKLEHIG